MKRLFTIFCTALLIFTIYSIPVYAQGGTEEDTVTARTIEVTNNSGDATSFDTYYTRNQAKQNPITYYASDEDFPITVKISTTGKKYNEYTFNSYGPKNVEHCVFLYDDSYARIVITPKPEEPEAESETETEDESQSTSVVGTSLIGVVAIGPSLDPIVIDAKVDKLMAKLDLDLFYPEKSRYFQDLQNYLTGTWDGSEIMDQSLADTDYVYWLSRRVSGRTYYLCGTDLRDYTLVDKAINLDYDGPLEVVPSLLPNLPYSLAVDRTAGVIEQWHFLDLQDTWQIPIAENDERIDYVFESGNGTDCRRASVSTTDVEGNSHFYSLRVDGIVEKIY